MKARQFILGSLIASVGAIAAPSFAEDVFIDVAPPAPRVEKWEKREGQVWVPGHWEWRDGKHEWVPGRYVAERKGYRYERDRWVTRDDNRWAYQRGGWTREYEGEGQ